MNQEMEFKNIVAQYSKVAPEEMNNEMKFREDLGFSSLDFMSFLGELEDTFDLELDETEDHNSWRSFKSAGRTSVIFFEVKLIKMSGSKIFCT